MGRFMLGLRLARGVFGPAFRVRSITGIIAMGRAWSVRLMGASGTRVSTAANGAI